MARSYRIPESVAAAGDTVRVRAQIACPAFTDLSDAVVPTEMLNVWEAALLAKEYENQNDMERATQFWDLAFKILNDAQRHLRGAARVPMNFRPHGLVSGRVHRVR